MEQTITSMQNPKVLMWRSLTKRSARNAHGLFLVEGPRMVEEALGQGSKVDCLLVEMGRESHFSGLLAMAKCDVYAVSPHIFKAVCDTKTPQGIAALVELPAMVPLDALGPLVVALDGVQDPGNVGTIMRTADAAGFTGILLSPQCADVYAPKTLRATMGSIFRLPARVGDALHDDVKGLLAKGYAVISSELGGEPFFQRKPEPGPQCLVIGSEGNGVSPEVSSLATCRLALPMAGGAESLNAAVAAAIMMYDMARERPEQGDR